MQVFKLSSEEWRLFSENAHAACFDEHMPKDLARIDFALMVGDDGTPIAYTTCREYDANTVYMQFGGAFPTSRGTIKSFRAYELLLQALKSHYVRATTLIENTNTAMLKFAMKAGFRVVGLRNFKGSILLEHLIEWEDNHVSNVSTDGGIGIAECTSSGAKAPTAAAL